MGQNFLQYWKPEQVDYGMSLKKALSRSGSGQFKRMKVQPGDVVWIITMRSLGELVLAGRILVAECVSFAEATERFQYDVWPAHYHVIAEPGTEEDLREISLMDVAEQLRFQSLSCDRLTISGGSVNAQQLQAMRRLDQFSVPLLEAKWYGTNLPSVWELEQQISKSGAGYGNPEMNREVERAAVEHVTQWYKAHGWKVQSVEAKKCGYDLLCEKHGNKEHVEVKGIQGMGMSFIITAGEVRHARSDEQFVICIVTSALTDHRQMSRYSGEEFVEKFNLVELAFRASLKV
jgi:hypothetical protein